MLDPPTLGSGVALELIGDHPAQQYCCSPDREPSRHRIHSTGSASALRNQRGNDRSRHRTLEYLKLPRWGRQGSDWARKHCLPGDQPGYSQEQEHPAHNAVGNVSAIVDFQCMKGCRDGNTSRYKEKHGASGKQSRSRGIARG